MKVKHLGAVQGGFLAAQLSVLPGVITPRCMQHAIGQPGMTDFAAVLHPHYVLQQNLSDFVFRVILQIALI